MATQNSKLPRIITEARAGLSKLVSSAFFRYGRSRGIKTMKKDYAEKILAVLDVMLQACALQFDGGLCRVSGNLARPLTGPEMATFSEVHQRTVERAIHDLKDMGLIKSEKQFKRLFPNGFKVAAVWRVFTRLFWEKLGLWSLFVESVKYAAQNGKLKLKRPLTRVGPKKKPDQIAEERRRSKQRTIWFLAMTQCVHRSRCKDCPGGYQIKEVCSFCRQFPT